MPADLHSLHISSNLLFTADYAQENKNTANRKSKEHLVFDNMFTWPI